MGLAGHCRAGWRLGEWETWRIWDWEMWGVGDVVNMRLSEYEKVKRII